MYKTKLSEELEKYKIAHLIMIQRKVKGKLIDQS